MAFADLFLRKPKPSCAMLTGLDAEKAAYIAGLVAMALTQPANVALRDLIVLPHAQDI